MKDFYKILGINSTASKAEVKAAYKKLAKEYHPDKHAGNQYYEEKFKLINEAYQTLIDENKKSKYDWDRWYYSSNVNATQSYYQSSDYQKSEQQYQNSNSKYSYRTSYSTGYHSNFSQNQNSENFHDAYKPTYKLWDNIKFYVISFGLLVVIGTIGLVLGGFMNQYASNEHVREGDRLYGFKLYANALGEYENALQFNEKNANAYYGRGIIKLNEFQDFVGAKYDFSMALKYSDTVNHEFLIKRAICLYNLKQYFDAVQDLDIVLKKHKFQTGNLYYFRGMCLVERHKKYMACDDFHKSAALKFQPAEDKILEFCQEY